MAGNVLYVRVNGRGGNGTRGQRVKAAAAGNGSRARGARPSRREHLVVRRVDPWPVLKLSVVFYVAVSAVALVAGTILWLGTTVTGVRGNVEQFIGDLVVAQDFRLVGWKMLQLLAVGSLSLVVLGTMANVVMITLFNLISDVIGGLTVVVEGAGTTRGAQAPPEPEAADLLPRRGSTEVVAREVKPGPGAARSEGPFGPPIA